MSKVKTNRLEPRSEDGTLTIGSPNGATMFDGDVNIPQYATTQWVIDTITGDIEPELANYQKRDEKNRPNGYAGLNANTKVDASYLDTTVIEQNIDTIETNIISVENTKVSKSGDTMTGQLNIQGANLHMQGSGGVTNLQLGANGDINAKVITSTGQINSHGDIQMFTSTIHGLADPTENSDAATKSYVDNAGAGSFLPIAGGTMTGDIDMSGQRVKDIPQIPLEDTDAASKYYVDASTETINHPVDVQVFPAVNEFTELFGVRNGGASCMRILGSGDWWSNHGRIREIADPVADDDAATKQYVDNAGGAIGRPFVLRSTGVNPNQLNVGEFFLSTENNAAWTSSLSSARFISFTYEDRGGLTWKTATDGTAVMPTGFIQLMAGNGVTAWWTYDTSDGAWNFSDGTGDGGGIIVPLKNYVQTGSISNLVTGTEYRINCPYW